MLRLTLGTESQPIRLRGDDFKHITSAQAREVQTPPFNGGSVEIRVMRVDGRKRTERPSLLGDLFSSVILMPQEAAQLPK